MELRNTTLAHSADGYTGTALAKRPKEPNMEMVLRGQHPWQVDSTHVATNRRAYPRYGYGDKFLHFFNCHTIRTPTRPIPSYLFRR